MNAGDLLLASVLLLQLDSPRFTERERAMQGLEAMGQRAVPVLLAARQTATTDGAQRMGLLLERRRSERFYAVLSQYKAGLPWLDALPLDFPHRFGIIDAYVYGWEDEGHPGPYPSYRGGTQRFMIDLNEAGVPSTEIAELLAKMKARCPAWRNGRWTDLPPPTDEE